MMGNAEALVFELLPENGLDRSVLLPVLVGLAYITLFTETLGWTFVALVVPGYLASVFIAAPACGFTMVAEALITYLLSRAIGLWLPKTRIWTVSFGRERFFLIILMSILVRLLSEGWMLPRLGAYFDFGGAAELYSIGLVVVPLTANALWNVGLTTGVRRTATITLLTWATVQYLLVPYTNLNLTYFELTYESVALDFLTASKAYLLLLSGALLAARANVRFGWDFNGILVPGLLAIAWYSPLKLASTFVEAVIVMVVARTLVSAGPLSRVLMEGPRRTFYAFSVGFALKFAAGHLSHRWLPGMQATDLYGFGYVLPSLLAVKMWQLGSVPRVLVPTLAISSLGFLVGNGIGYAVAVAMDEQAPEPSGAITRRSSAARELIRASSWPSRPRLDRELSGLQEVASIVYDLRERSDVRPTHGIQIAEVASQAGNLYRVLHGGEAFPHLPVFAVSASPEAAGIVGVKSEPCGMLSAVAIEIADAVQASVVVVARSETSLNAFVQLLSIQMGEEETLELHGSEQVAQLLTQHGALDLLESRAVSLFAIETAELQSSARALDGLRSSAERFVPKADARDLRCFSSIVAPAMNAVEPPSAYARAVAAQLGFSFEDDPGAGRRALVSRLQGGMVWLRSVTVDASSAVVVPFPMGHAGLLAAGQWVHRELGFRDLVAAGALMRYQPDIGIGSYRSQSYLQRTVETLLGDGETQVVVVRVLPTHQELIDVAGVFSDGEVSEDPAASHPEFVSWFQDHIGAVEWFDGTRRMFPFRGAGDPMVGFGRQFASRQVLLTWWSSRARSIALRQGLEPAPP
ncbi:MAG: poly-gamma-glutamate biosynthesis protein PgsC/CapC [Myxococcota bacterium]